MTRLNAQQLRELEEKKAQGDIRSIKRHPIYFILENIYDTYNIGGLFRLADAIAAEKIYLCGEMEIPPNSRIKKASIGTYKVVDWEYKKSAREAINDLNSKQYQNSNDKNSKGFENLKLGNSNLSLDFARDGELVEPFRASDFGFRISFVAVEQHPIAISYTEASYNLPLALIFGNESYGVLPETLELVDQIVEIPMFGINKSLNVIVSAAIVSYWVMNGL